MPRSSVIPAVLQPLEQYLGACEAEYYPSPNPSDCRRYLPGVKVRSTCVSWPQTSA